MLTLRISFLSQLMKLAKQKEIKLKPNTQYNDLLKQFKSVFIEPENVKLMWNITLLNKDSTILYKDVVGLTIKEALTFYRYYSQNFINNSDNFIDLADFVSYLLNPRDNLDNYLAMNDFTENDFKEILFKNPFKTQMSFRKDINSSYLRKEYSEHQQVLISLYDVDSNGNFQDYSKVKLFIRSMNLLELQDIFNQYGNNLIQKNAKDLVKGYYDLV